MIVVEYDILIDCFELFFQECVIVCKEFEILKFWGDFFIEIVKKLEVVGLEVQFLVCFIKKYNLAWVKEYFIVCLCNFGVDIYFVGIIKVEVFVEIFGVEMIFDFKNGMVELQAWQVELDEFIVDINVCLDWLV